MRTAAARSALVGVTLTLVTACSDDTAVAPPDKGVDTQFVTGAAAAALDANGRFLVSASSGWHRPELTADDAANLSEIYISRIAPTLPSWFERHRGEPIAFAALRRCGQPLYAHSPYIEPAENLSPGIINAVASRWIFTYCDNEQRPVISVAVAATATHLRVDNGSIDPLSWRGNEFHAAGIPIGRTSVISAERAVERLATEAKARVARVPELVLPGLQYFPQSARWFLQLDRDVEAEGNKAIVRRDRAFFVGRDTGSWTIAVYRSAGVTEDVITRPSGQRITFLRRPEIPGRWEAVRFVGERP